MIFISNSYAATRNCLILASGQYFSYERLEQQLQLPAKSIFANYYTGNQIVLWNSTPINGNTQIIFCNVHKKEIYYESCSVHSGITSEFPYAISSVPGKVLAATNFGNVLLFDTETKEIDILSRSTSLSFQIYTALKTNNSNLLGEYPHVSILSWEEDNIKNFDSQILFQGTVLVSKPEAQSLRLYRGDLYAGVWPWGQLWHLDANAKQWTLTARLFDEPDIGSHREGPYYGERNSNDLGQRVPFLVSFGDSLYGVTSSKDNVLSSDQDIAPLSPKALYHYGELFKLTRTGALSVPGPDRVDGSMHVIRIKLFGTKIILYINGERIDEAPIVSDIDVCKSNIVLASGLYGKLENAVVRLRHFDKDCRTDL